MKTVEWLIQFIDDYTCNGNQDPPQLWGDDEFIQEKGISYLKNFESSDWNILHKEWKNRSYPWIMCLIDLLYGVDNYKSQELIVNIGLLGDDEETLDAMECIQEFIEEIDVKVKEKLKQKTAEIIRDRMRKINLKKKD